MKGKNIYLAEDDSDDIKWFQDVMEEICSEGAVTVFYNGEELLERLKDTTIPLPDMILLDINMPVMNGFECLKNIRSGLNLKDVPVVILTTSSSRTTIEITYKLGANYFIKKPSNYIDLKKMLQSVLEIDWQNYSKPESSDAFIYKYN